MKKTLTIAAVAAVASMSAAAYACGPMMSWEARYDMNMARAEADYNKNKTSAAGPQICVTYAGFAARGFRTPRDKRVAAYALVAKCARQVSAVTRDKEAKEKFIAIAKKADDDAKQLSETKELVKKVTELKAPSKSTN